MVAWQEKEVVHLAAHITDEEAWLVDLGFACFGIFVQDGKVVDAAPISRYCIGWTADRAYTYFTGRGKIKR